MKDLVKASSGTAISAPTIPATMMPDGNGQQYGQRMQLDRPAQQERLQHVALDLHHHDDPGQHDQRLDPAEGDQRDDDRDEAGDEGPDQGNEGTDEDQRGQSRRHRDTKDQRHDQHPDAHRPRATRMVARM